MNYYALDNHVTCKHVYTCEGNDTSQEEAGEGQKGFHIYRLRVRVAAKHHSRLQSPVEDQNHMTMS